MADTVLTDLKIHDFDSLAQMSQYESEIGENDIVLTPDISCRLPLLTPMWFDHLANDVSWLRADTFSWQSGDVYVAAYEHLVDDAFSATINGEKYYAWDVSILSPTTYYTKSFTPNQGDIVYEKSGTGEMIATEYTVTSVAGTELTLSDGSIVRADIKFVFTETIGDITITFYRAEDGHKICLPEQESNLVALYESTGVAWYYILDTTNKQFKLPRTKHGFTGLRDSVGGYVKPGAPNITGSVGEYWTQAASGAFYSDSQNKGSETNTSHGTNNLSFDASRSSSVYGASDTIQPPATQMYLYFYVGFYAQEAVEQTAGINAEMFNDLNAHKVIEFQAPTADNNYTWYRKYADGWVEQGGQLTGRSITFPIPFAQEPTLAFADKSSVNTAVYHNTYSSLTTTGFTGWRMGTNSNWLGSESDWAGKWVAYGMAA